MGVGIPGWTIGTPSAMAGDSISHFGGSIIGDGEGDTSSQYVLGDDSRLDVDGDRDVDASIRALRPRSSRRGSWDSEASDWSAPVGTGMSTGTPSRSVWTSNSNRTGGHLSMESGGPNEKSMGSRSVDNVDSHGHPTPVSPAEPLQGAEEETQPPLEESSLPKGVETTPKKKVSDLIPSVQESSAGVPLPENQHKGAETCSSYSHCHLSLSNAAAENGNGHPESKSHTDHNSLADIQTDVYNSASTAPLV